MVVGRVDLWWGGGVGRGINVWCGGSGRAVGRGLMCGVVGEGGGGILTFGVVGGGGGRIDLWYGGWYLSNDHQTSK